MAEAPQLSNSLLAYETYVQQFQMKFGIGVAPPTYSEFLTYYPQLGQQQRERAPLSSIPAQFLQQPAKQPVAPGPSVVHQSMQQSSSSQCVNPSSSTGKIKRTRETWPKNQALVLVATWKANFDDLESHKAPEIWRTILTEVNKHGKQRTLKSLKDKIRNLKDAYKAAKKHNDENTGVAPKFSQFYEEFDEIYGCRDVIKMPHLFGAMQQHQQPVESDEEALSIALEDDTYFLDDTGAGSSIVDENEGSISETVPVQSSAQSSAQTSVQTSAKPSLNVTPKQLKKSRSTDKGKGKAKGKPFREELLELQRQQIKVFEDQSEKTENFFKDMMQQQLNHEKKEKEMERKLLLELGKLFTDKKQKSKED